MNYDIVVIGGGPAGLAAAIEAKRNGVNSILVIEREKELGGILQQCIHNGFGLHIFKEELTGPEYADRFITELEDMNIEFKLDTMVLDISENKLITAVNSVDGYLEIESRSIIFAMGCRERTRGAIAIPGYRPAGVLTAGAAQRYINIEGYMVGKKAVILGSGDIGLIMARRLVLEGAEVQLVCELQPFSSGLTRNIVQCLHDYDIPLKLSHTVVDIKGKNRLKSVTVAEVDENLKPIKGTEVEYACDTLLLSIGLIPENELSHKIGIKMDHKTSGPIVNEHMETNIKGIFACGNVVHVHDLVDYVTEEAYKAGKAAADYIKGNKDTKNKMISILSGSGVSYVVPQEINVDMKGEYKFLLRVNSVYKDHNITVMINDKIIKTILLKYMVPGEMQSLTLDFSEIDLQLGKKIEIQITPQEV